MSDYKDSFREKFPYTISKLGELRTADILAFIDKVVAEREKEHDECCVELTETAGENYKLGRAAEREELVAHVEGMKQEQGAEFSTHLAVRNSTLDDLLAHLRQSDAPKAAEQVSNIQKVGDEAVKSTQQGCCTKCYVENGELWYCQDVDCPCHQKAPQGDSVEEK